ncbi:MAG: hypothetical protein QOH14_2706 [Pseudonocardiales bacterium]|nr:hypothetical protein [Pseudonocardiales bacterium]
MSGMGVEIAHESTKAAPKPTTSAPRVTQPVAPVSPVPLSAQPMMVGHAEDRAEHDADQVAATALSRLRRSAGHEGHEAGRDELRRSPAPGAQSVVGWAGGTLDRGTSATIEQRRGGGRPLPAPVRARMETAFGASFSAVRIHDDEKSAELNDAVSARAFTTGKDIFFGRDQYAPQLPAGEQVLAHELAHTLQRSSGEVQRWWPFAKDDAATSADKAAKKEKSAAEKAQKTSAAEKKKAEDAASKAAVAAAKLREKDEDKKLTTERQAGVGMRGALAEQIGVETWATKSIGADEHAKAGAVSTKQGSKTLQNVQKLFARALEVEATTVAKLVGEGLDPDAAADAAYKTVWLDQTWLPSQLPQLRAVRPPRETSSERLASKIREQRNVEGVDAQQAKSNAEFAAKRGTLLTPELEEVYERWESWIQDDIASGFTPEEAEKHAEALIWAHADPDVTAKRPKDAKVEEAARKAARDRLKAGIAKKPASMSDIDVADRGLSAAGAARPIVSAISGVVSAGFKAGGAAKDAELAKAEGKSDLVSHSDATKVPIVGGVVKASENAKSNFEHGVRDPNSLKASKVSVDTQVASGIGAVTGIFNDVLAGSKAMVKAIKAIGAANEKTNTETVLVATKASADTASTLASLGSDAAKLAAVIDGGVAGAVAKVLPGFSIVTSVTNMISGILRIRDLGTQQDKANQGLFTLRTAKENSATVDVLVRPLQLMISALDKKYEQAVWSMIQAVSDTVTNITTLATGGGFGIPAAVQAGMKALDLLHTVGHMVDDNLRAMAAQASRKDSIGALEGAAEAQLRKDPALAMDAIIMQAKGKKDPVALNFLKTYGISPDNVADLPMTTLRERALFEIGVGADPLTTYQTIKKIGGGILGTAATVVAAPVTLIKDSVSETVDQYGGAKQLAADRKELDGKDRDWKWRLQMAFKSKESYERSVAQTATKTGPKPAPDAPAAALCKVGAKVLFAAADEKQQTAFAETIKDLPLADLLKAANDPKNSTQWREIIQAMINERLKAQAAKKLPAPPVPPRPKKAAPPLPPRPAKAPASSSVGA